MNSDCLHSLLAWSTPACDGTRCSPNSGCSINCSVSYDTNVAILLKRDVPWQVWRSEDRLHVLFLDVPHPTVFELAGPRAPEDLSSLLTSLQQWAVIIDIQTVVCSFHMGSGDQNLDYPLG